MFLGYDSRLMAVRIGVCGRSTGRDMIAESTELVVCGYSHCKVFLDASDADTCMYVCTSA